MLRALLQAGLDLISSSPCPLCAGPADPTGAPGPCPACRGRFAWPEGGLTGPAPLPWRGLGWYAGPYRSLLLNQRQRPKGAVLRGLAQALAAQVPGGIGGTILVSIPSWKRQGNPLPGVLVQQLIVQPGQGPGQGGRQGARARALLQRSRPTLGQHHLNRQLRLSNQEGAFRVPPGLAASLPQLRQQPIWLVDDILTTGATALAAATALEQAGLKVMGLLCLARTPDRGPETGTDALQARGRGRAPSPEPAAPGPHQPGPADPSRPQAATAGWLRRPGQP